MKMIKTLFLSCFFILTMSLTGCLTIEDGVATVSTTDTYSTTTTDSYSSDSSSRWGGGDGIFGTSIGDGQIGW